MHFAVTLKEGNLGVAIRPKRTELCQRKLEKYILWGPIAITSVALFIFHPAFVQAFPSAVPEWKVRMKKIAAALIKQGWEHCDARRSSVERDRVPKPPLIPEVAAWIEEITALEMESRGTQSLPTVFEELYRLGFNESEKYCLLRVGA